MLDYTTQQHRLLPLLAGDPQTPSSLVEFPGDLPFPSARVFPQPRTRTLLLFVHASSCILYRLPFHAIYDFFIFLMGDFMFNPKSMSRSLVHVVGQARWPSTSWVGSCCSGWPTRGRRSRGDREARSSHSCTSPRPATRSVTPDTGR